MSGAQSIHREPSPLDPACPCSIEFIGPDWDGIANRAVPDGKTDSHIFFGVTRREYFMARAPMPVPQWFFPTMRPCPAVPSVNGVDDLEFKGRLIRWMGGDGDDQQAEAWSAAQDEAVKAQEQWQADFRRELLLQWPGYWADEMLKRSGA